MKVISFKLADGLHAKLERLAKARQQTKSDVVRAALEQMLSGNQPALAVTVGDLAGDLLGSAEGPCDLATNPKHMEGYGR